MSNKTNFKQCALCAILPLDGTLLYGLNHRALRWLKEKMMKDASKVNNDT